MVDLTIPQPITADIYYSSCVKIDRNNRYRQESLYIYIKLGTKDWSNRFNLYTFGVDVVDVWLEYQGITRTSEIQPEFYNYLDEYMLDNTYNRFMIRRAEGRRRTIFDYDDNYVNYYNPLFG